MTLTSGPTGSSETSLPASVSADGNILPIEEEHLATSSAYLATVEPPPSVVRQAGEISADLISPTPRENTVPQTELDAKDRCEIRATRSAETLDLQIKLEKHRNWLEWQQTKRHLVVIAGLMAMSGAWAFGLKYAGVQPKDVAKLTGLAFISGIGGYGLHSLRAKVWHAISSRNSPSQRESSRLHSVSLLATSLDARLFMKGASTNPPINPPATVTPVRTTPAEYVVDVVRRAITKPNISTTAVRPLKPPVAACIT